MKRVLFFGIILTLASCSLVRKTAVNATADIASTGENQVLTLTNWSQIQHAVPSNLLFLETLLPSSPKNLALLSQLIKGYSAAGFAVGETVRLSDSQSQDAAFYYRKALDYGEQYLSLQGISMSSLTELINDQEQLKKKLPTSQSHHRALFYTGVAWAGLANLNRNMMTLVSHAPVAKALLDHVCAANPTFEEGLCLVFNAVYEFSRPKILGGDHKKGSHLFAQATQEYPKNLLFPLLQVQYEYMAQDQKQEAKTALLKVEKNFREWQNAEKNPHYLSGEWPQHINLYNAVAFERFKFFSK
jgi:hypothetical protein